MTRIDWLERPSDRDLDAVARIVNQFWREVIPGEPDRPTAELAVAIREVPAHRSVSLAVARDHRGDIVGAAELTFEGYAGRENAAWLKYLVVDAATRRRGTGRQLLDAVAEQCRSAGRTRLSHVVARAHAAGAAFATSSGAIPALVDVQNRLLVADLDRRTLESWIARADDRAEQYSIVAFDGVCPDEWLEPYTRVVDVMNDAPRSEATEAAVVTADQVRDNMEVFARQGNVMWTACARDDATGEFVGFTELAFGPFRPWLASQGDTAVHPDHRERGIGRWLKAINALRMLDERPEVTAVDTWNAGVNAAMLSINTAMGFRPIAEWQEWELSL